MADIISLIDLENSRKSPQLWKFFIESIEAKKCFRNRESSELKPILSYVYTSLSERPTADVLALLHLLVEQCTYSVFSEYCQLWTKLLIKILKNEEEKSVVGLAVEILIHLFDFASSFPALSRKLSVDVPTLLTLLLRVVPENRIPYLRCLQVVLQVFPGSCGSSLANIDKCLWTFVDGLRDDELELCASCVAVLPSLGGGREDHSNHIASWKMQLAKLCNTVNAYLDMLFANFQAAVKVSDTSPQVEFPQINATGPIEEFCNIHHRTTFLFSCIIQMLSCQMPFQVPIPISSLLKIAGRIIVVKESQLHIKTTLATLLLASLPTLHTKVLEVLHSLMKCCGRHLVAHSDFINQFLVRTFKSFSSQRKQTSGLRDSAYEVLRMWLSIEHICRTDENCSETFVEAMLYEITPSRDVVHLMLSNNKMPVSITNIAKKKHRNLPKVNEIYHKADNDQLNHHVCLNALKALQMLLNTSGAYLKPACLKNIHERVISLILEIQRQPNHMLSPYNVPSCRAELYKVLLAVISNPNPRCHPPFQTAVSLFSRGSIDTDLEVLSVCHQASTACDLIVHPLLPLTRVPLAHIDTKAVSPSSPVESDVCASDNTRGVHQPSTEEVSALNATEKAVFGTSQRSSQEVGEIEVNTTSSDDSNYKNISDHTQNCPPSSLLNIEVINLYESSEASEVECVLEESGVVSINEPTEKVRCVSDEQGSEDLLPRKRLKRTAKRKDNETVPNVAYDDSSNHIVTLTDKTIPSVALEEMLSSFVDCPCDES